MFGAWKQGIGDKKLGLSSLETQGESEKNLCENDLLQIRILLPRPYILKLGALEDQGFRAFSFCIKMCYGVDSQFFIGSQYYRGLPTPAFSYRYCLLFFQMEPLPHMLFSYPCLL